MDQEAVERAMDGTNDGSKEVKGAMGGATDAMVPPMDQEEVEGAMDQEAAERAMGGTNDGSKEVEGAMGGTNDGSGRSRRSDGSVRSRRSDGS